MEAWSNHTPYHKLYRFVPLQLISPQLRHAVVAAEDARFYEHYGFDWDEIEIQVDETFARRPSHGASTITQQLVKNLFLTTRRSFIRKGIEFTIVPLMEVLLSKDRILELYLNVIKWGPGVYGAEARRFPLSRCGAEPDAGTGDSTGGRSARSATAQAGANDRIWRGHCQPDDANGL